MVLGALLSRLFVDFFGGSFSTWFLIRFYMNLGTPNRSKIVQKSIPNRFFFVIGAALGFFMSKLAFRAQFFINFWTCEPSFRSDPTAFFEVFTNSQQSRRQRYQCDFWAQKSIKKHKKIDEIRSEKLMKSDNKRTTRILTNFHEILTKNGAPKRS